MGPLAHRGSREDEQMCMRQLTHLLENMRPRDARGKADRTRNLCLDCCKYRPTRRGYWAAQLARTDTSGWGRSEGELWQSAVKWFAAGIKVQCPACRLAEHMAEELETVRARR
ncbi:acid phosphatase (PhoG) [Purpureocillium lavendulum]|uniref:Acid phosphatase (PhoG) n=1 Tax=Purpureocillium lavendulum TaxID=1247861 RepID=A0AB34FST7_9HYPO|nr:acid phosphatase (PhoG) [Purpureocillium lavendulum]